MIHCIMLLQPGKKSATRTYSDYDNINECLEGLYIYIFMKV